MKKEIGKWKVLESEYLIERPWLTARRDRVQLPSGVVHPEYYVLEYPNWVNIIARRRDGMFILVEQYRHGLADVFTELVAGVIEEGETPEDACLLVSFRQEQISFGIACHRYIPVQAN